MEITYCCTLVGKRACRRNVVCGYRISQIEKNPCTGNIRNGIRCLFHAPKERNLLYVGGIIPPLIILIQTYLQILPVVRTIKNDIINLLKVISLQALIDGIHDLLPARPDLPEVERVPARLVVSRLP